MPSCRTVVAIEAPDCFFSFVFFLLGVIEGKGRETGNICLLQTRQGTRNKIGGKHRLTISSRLMHAKARSDQSAARVMP